MDQLTVSLVFVYGSLRKHEGNHRLLESAQLISSQCSTEGYLYDTGHGYPALVQNHKGRVYGELYQVSPGILRRLDALEGFYGEGKNNDYERVVQSIQTDTGVKEAFVYVYQQSKVIGLEPIQLGDWKFNRVQKQNKDIYYFAYGSCMDDERFKSKNKEHFFQHVLGRGRLEGFSLKFTYKAYDGGRADLVETGGTVEGKAYLICMEALEYLLEREGVYRNRYRPAFVDIYIGNKMEKDVLTFLVIDKAEEEIPPPEYYLEEILRGGKTIWSAEYAKRFEVELLEKGMRKE
ncbi:gamma-glutamylcyclotransferase [Cohnella sp.]|uniref:gamma-glutamylcyclotransferase n=1 Tax=Cohnella sp. TaxID=1883426 RepID=UPI00356A89F7